MANGSKKPTKPLLKPRVTPGERPRLKDIAYMTGLGVTTVSRALNDAPDIGQGTKERVRLVANQIGYRPNRAGVRLRTGKTNVICLILNAGDEGMGLMAPLISGISQFVGDTHYHLVVNPYGLDQDPLESVKYVVETGAADGVILSRTEPNDPRVRYLLEHRVPFATHGRTDMNLEHAYYDFDNERYTRMAVGLLQDRGRARISLIAPPATLTFSRHMVGGFRSEMKKNNLVDVDIENITTDSPYADIQTEIETLLATENRPNGIICGSSDAAVATVAAIEKLGLKLGKDIDVVTKDSLGLLIKLCPNLIVIPENFRIAGKNLARSVIALINGEKPQDHQILYTP